MPNNVKYELIIEEASEVGKAMKNLYDIAGIAPRYTEDIVRNAPSVVTSFLSEDEANSLKEQLEADGSAVYSVNEADLTYKVVINDHDFYAQIPQRSKVMSTLLNVLGCDPKTAKEIVDEDPSVVKSDISYDEAESIKNELLESLSDICSDISVEPYL